MTTIEAILPTTHVDLHGDRMSLEALQSMVDALNTTYIPLGVEHDPRVPQAGRVTRAWLEAMPDGQTAIKAEIELFDGTADDYAGDGREIHTKSFEDDRLTISFDRNFRNDEDQALLRSLTEHIDAKLQEEIKKAFDPLSVLAIGGAFIAGGIATGFLGKLGEDGYEALKSGLKRLFSRAKGGEKDRLLMLEFAVTRNGGQFIVEVIASNPTSEQIDRLLSLELQRLDSLVDAAVRSGNGLKKLVFELQDGNLLLKFGVRRDGVPIVWRSHDREA